MGRAVDTDKSILGFCVLFVFKSLENNHMGIWYYMCLHSVMLVALDVHRYSSGV